MPRSKWDRVVANLHDVDENVERAVAACEDLNRAADESRLAALHELLDDPNFLVREAAAIPVARLEGLRALPRLLRALQRGTEEGHDNDLLGSVISDLVWTQPDRAALRLFSMFDDPSPQQRSYAAWLWGFANTAVTPEPLLSALVDSSPDVRASAVGSLGSFPEWPGVRDYLIRALSDREEEVRVSAASALGYLGDRSAEDALRNAVHDPSERVRWIAEYALEQLLTNGGSATD